MLLLEILTQVERSNLDAAQFVRGLRDENVILAHVRRFLEARACSLRLRNPRLDAERVDRAWVEKAVADVETMEGRLAELRTGLRALLSP